MKTFPILYKKTNTGAIQSWSIEVQEETGCALIVTTHGQVDGKLQRTSDTITKGKNEGKTNATNYTQQAEAEAEAKHTKQKKKGYVETIEAAQAGEVDNVIEGGILPMLAPSKIYPTFKHKLRFPVYVQGKYDGSRCIAIIKNGKCTLWSRTRKQIHSAPHIIAAYEKALPSGNFMIDGELFNFDYKDNFEDLMSLIRPDNPREGHEAIQHHVYDFPSNDGNFVARWAELMELRKLFDENSPIKFVGTWKASDDEAIMKIHEKNLELGLEGSMIRNDGPYEFGKRSYHLQKLKNFEDMEVKIVGIEEGRGKDAGTVGAFLCVTDAGVEFKARLKATYERRTELFNDPKQWQNQLLTVTYQGITAYGALRFPIGKSIRNYE